MFRTFTILLTMTALWQTGLLAEDADKSSSPIVTAESLNAQLQSLDALPGDAQLQMKIRIIKQLQSRLQTAGKHTLSLKEFERFKLKLNQVQRESTAGNAPSTAVLKKVAKRIVSLERKAIEKVALEYRVVIYNTFRTQRQEYEFRRAMGDAVVRSWNVVENANQHNVEMLNWFGQATALSKAAQNQPLPPLPQFVTNYLTEVSGDAKTNIAKKFPGKVIPKLPQPKLPKKNGPEEYEELVAPKVKLSHSPEEGYRPSVVKPQSPSLQRRENVAVKPTRRESVSTLETVKPTTAERVNRLPAENLDAQRLRQQQRQLAIESKTNLRVRKSSPLSEFELEKVTRTSEVKVDTGKLISRIAGYNQAITLLKQTLRDQPAKPYSGTQLVSFMNQLDEFSVRRGDMLPYYKLVPKSVQPALAKLTTPASLSTLLAKKITRSRAYIKSDAYPGSAAQRRLELELVDSVSLRLAELVAKTNSGD